MKTSNKKILADFLGLNCLISKFDNAEFDSFVKSSIGYSICNNNYTFSFALRKFIYEGDSSSVNTLCYDLLEYFENTLDEVDKEYYLPSIIKCKKIIDDDCIPNFAFEASLKRYTPNYIQKLLEELTDSINRGKFSSALTKIRSLLEDILIWGLKKKDIEVKSKGNITSLVKDFSDSYNMHVSQEWDIKAKTLVSGINKIISSITEYRNCYGDAHGLGEEIGPIKKRHAKLCINSGIVLADFLVDVIINNFNNLDK